MNSTLVIKYYVSSQKIIRTSTSDFFEKSVNIDAKMKSITIDLNFIKERIFYGVSVKPT